MESKIQKHKPIAKEKVVSILFLYVMALLIVMAGTALGIFSAANNIKFSVLSQPIPGIVFSLVIVFLGLRYLFSVHKLQKEVYKPESTFSWRNFRISPKN